MKYKILVVEDDINLLETLKYNLTKEGYGVITAADGITALDIANEANPDLIILDLMLPGMSGLEVCRILRKKMTVPILMLTAKSEEIDKVVGLEVGADDYITKPFSMRELQARIRALLRRVTWVTSEIASEVKAIKTGEIEVNIARHQAYLKDKELILTPKEFELLAFLMVNKGFVFNRDTLLEKVWGYDYPGDTRTVDVHIRWLRQKIENNPAKPEYLVTVRGTGYKIKE
jgi:two-component system OmpR family response regulator